MSSCAAASTSILVCVPQSLENQHQRFLLHQVSQHHLRFSCRAAAPLSGFCAQLDLPKRMRNARSSVLNSRRGSRDPNVKGDGYRLVRDDGPFCDFFFRCRFAWFAICFAPGAVDSRTTKGIIRGVILQTQTAAVNQAQRLHTSKCANTPRSHRQNLVAKQLLLLFANHLALAILKSFGNECDTGQTAVVVEKHSSTWSVWRKVRDQWSIWITLRHEIQNCSTDIYLYLDS